MKKYIMFLIPWYISIISLFLFNIKIPILFIILLSILYCFVSNIILINYNNNLLNNNDIFNIISLYVLNIFFSPLLFYYENYLVSFIIGVGMLYFLFNIKIKNV